MNASVSSFNTSSSSSSSSFESPPNPIIAPASTPSSSKICVKSSVAYVLTKTEMPTMAAVSKTARPAPDP